MKLGISVRRESDYYFIKKRYIEYFSDFEIIFIYPYNNACAHAYWDIDGFLIIGGADINPIRYNEENYASLGIVDEIDEMDLKIIEYAVTRNKPLFGICRGLQVINVYFKGTLKQHIFNHEDKMHKIILVDDFSSFPLEAVVNSYHHQSVKKLGNNLKVLYYSLDGEVECFIHEYLPIIAVQFHPEMDADDLFYNSIKAYFLSLLKVYK